MRKSCLSFLKKSGYNLYSKIMDIVDEVEISTDKIIDQEQRMKQMALSNYKYSLRRKAHSYLKRMHEKRNSCFELKKRQSL